MQTLRRVQEALQLLTRADQRKLFLVTLAQSSLALLDLLGVALIGIVAAASTALVQGGTPPIIGNWFGIAEKSKDELASFLLTLGVIAGVLLIGKSILSLLLTRRIYGFLAKRQAWVAGQLVMRLVQMPMAQIQARSSQSTAYALMAGVNAAVLGVLGSGVVVISEAALLGVLGVGLAVVAPIVSAFTALFFVGVALVVHKTLASWAGTLGAITARAEVASLASIQELIHTYRELSVMGRRANYAGRFEALRGTASAAQAGTQLVNLVPKYVFEIALVAGAGILAASQLFTKDVPAAAAIIAVFLTAASRVMPSMLRLQSSLIIIRGYAAVAASTYELVRQVHWDPQELAPAAIAHSGNSKRDGARNFSAIYDDFDADVSVDDVTYSYDGAGAPALKKVAFKVPKGTSLGIVGSTGAGKSTLADVAMGLSQPDSGRVLLGGLPPNEAIERWPGAIGCVPQDVSIVEGTVRANVALGMLENEVHDDQVWKALEKAQLASFLREQREGLETVVGEHGLRLSGGQRQRLGLARALYSQPKLLFLDEATSALDAETERVISSAIAELSGQLTLIVIAHRLSTIRGMDQVAYLEGGELRAIGTFSEVRSAVPEFDKQSSLMGL